MAQAVTIPPPPRTTGNALADAAAIVGWVWDFYESTIVSGGVLQPSELGDLLATDFPTLRALGAITGAADHTVYFTAPNTWATTGLTAFGRSLIDDVAAINARSTLGLGALAVLNSVGTSEIDNDAVTFAKFQNITDVRLIGRSAGSAGDAQEITVGAGINLAAGALTSTITQYTDEQAQDAVGNIIVDSSEINFTYDDATPSITAALINNSVVVGRMAFTTTDRLCGRQSGGAGGGEEITCTAAGRALLDDADAAAQRTTLGVTATGADTTYAFRANNLSDLANAATARTNLGLAAFATQSADLTIIPRVPQYTVATLPAAADHTRGLITVSDETGGYTLAFSDGANWRRVQDRAVVS